MEEAAGGLRGAGLQRVREVGMGASHRGKAAGRLPVGRCGEIAFSSIVFASYFVVSHSSVMTQATELAHLNKDSLFSFENLFRRHCVLDWIGCWDRCIRTTQ